MACDWVEGELAHLPERLGQAGDNAARRAAGNILFGTLSSGWKLDVAAGPVIFLSGRP